MSQLKNVISVIFKTVVVQNANRIQRIVNIIGHINTLLNQVLLDFNKLKYSHDCPSLENIDFINASVVEKPEMLIGS